MFKEDNPDTSEITGVILAGGKGSRLSSVVSDRPKVLAEIHGRPFLAFLLDQLVSAGIRDVVLCTGYRADAIHKEIGETYKSLKIVHSPEQTPLGTAGAVRNALQYLHSDTLILMNGDSFIDVDLNGYFEWFFGRSRSAAMLLTNVPDEKRYGKVKIAEDDSVLSFEEKGDTAGEGLINAGIYIFKKDLITSIPPDIFYSLEWDFLPKLVGSSFYGYRCKGKFIDIGTPESYLCADEFFRSKN